MKNPIDGKPIQPVETSRENLTREKLIEIVTLSVVKAHEQNPNALGFIIHGSRADTGVEGKKQPREGVDLSDLDVITIRRNGDTKAPEILASILWKNIGPKYGIGVDTGPWGSMEWEDVLKAVGSQDDKEKFRRDWRHLGNTSVIIGADAEINDTLKRVFHENI